MDDEFNYYLFIPYPHSFIHSLDILSRHLIERSLFYSLE